MLPLARPVAVVHVIPACRTFSLFLSITVVRIKLVTHAIYRRLVGVQPTVIRAICVGFHFHPPAHWSPNEPTLRIGSAIAVVSPVAIAAPAPANFLPLQYVLSL